MNNIFKIMDKIDYGFKDEKNYNLINNPKLWNDNFYDFYYTLSPKEVLEKECGTCIDQVELERFLLNENNLSCASYFIYFDDNKECPSHTFITYHKDNYFYWYEHSWFEERGNHKYKTIDDLLCDVKNKFIKSRKDEYQSSYPIYIYKYNKPPYHLSYIEFVKYIKTQEQINNYK